MLCEKHVHMYIASLYVCTLALGRDACCGFTFNHHLFSQWNAEAAQPLVQSAMWRQSVASIELLYVTTVCLCYSQLEDDQVRCLNDLSVPHLNVVLQDASYRHARARCVWQAIGAQNSISGPSTQQLCQRPAADENGLYAPSIVLLDVRGA